jgi:hypothetical protein
MELLLKHENWFINVTFLESRVPQHAWNYFCDAKIALPPITAGMFSILLSLTASSRHKRFVVVRGVIG